MTHLHNGCERLIFNVGIPSDDNFPKTFGWEVAHAGNNLSGESTVLYPGAVVYNLCITRYVRKSWQCNMLCKLIAPIRASKQIHSENIL
jgi:hypothetical protein